MIIFYFHTKKYALKNVRVKICTDREDVYRIYGENSLYPLKFEMFFNLNPNV
jgi:hypothetical protein